MHVGKSCLATTKYSLRIVSHIAKDVTVEIYTLGAYLNFHKKYGMHEKNSSQAVICDSTHRVNITS